MQQQKLSRLMQLSWEIQRKKKRSRAKAIQAAWAILLNEDITVYYLIKRHSHQNYPNKAQAKELVLFQSN